MSVVDLDTAKAAKLAGFSIPTEHYYLDKDIPFVKKGLKRTKNGEKMNHNAYDEFIYSAPTIEEHHNWKTKHRQFTGIRDWKLQDINEGSIVKTQQGTKFVVEWSDINGWCLIQSNKGNEPDLQGNWFALEKYMQPNLEVIGSIYDNPELMND